jgi:Ca-activated chloride channel family protein
MLVLLSCTSLKAQVANNASPIIFIYDASGSMWGELEGRTKKEIAVEVLSTVVSGLSAQQAIGLVAYGHRNKEDCEDVEFAVPADNTDKKKVIDRIRGFTPLGKTPLAHSTRLVIQSLKARQAKATIILVTDGIESCEGDICDVVKSAIGEGIEFRMHIVGFGLQGQEVDQLRCAAGAARGQYFDAADASGLSTSLQEATTATVDEPNSNVSLIAEKNGKPIDAIVEAFPSGAKEAIRFARTYRDTAKFYLPKGSYSLHIRPLEGSDVNAIILSHLQSKEDGMAFLTASFNAGKIKVQTYNNQAGVDALVHILAGGKVITQGRTYGKESLFDLNPGRYDVTVKAIAIDGVSNEYRFADIDVRPTETVSLEHTFRTGTLLIGAHHAAGLTDALVTITDTATKKNVASGRTYTQSTHNPKRFILTTGTYDITVSAVGSGSGKKEVFTIRIEENKTVERSVSF